MWLLRTTITNNSESGKRNKPSRKSNPLFVPHFNSIQCENQQPGRVQEAPKRQSSIARALRNAASSSASRARFRRACASRCLGRKRRRLGSYLARMVCGSWLKCPTNRGRDEDIVSGFSADFDGAFVAVSAGSVVRHWRMKAPVRSWRSQNQKDRNGAVLTSPA